MKMLITPTLKPYSSSYVTPYALVLLFLFFVFFLFSLEALFFFNIIHYLNVGVLVAPFLTLLYKQILSVPLISSLICMLNDLSVKLWTPISNWQLLLYLVTSYPSHSTQSF